MKMFVLFFISNQSHFLFTKKKFCYFLPNGKTKVNDFFIESENGKIDKREIFFQQNKNRLLFFESKGLAPNDYTSKKKKNCQKK